MNSRVLAVIFVLALSVVCSGQSTTPSTSGLSDQASLSSRQPSATHPQSSDIVGGRLIQKEDPKYPKQARKEKLEGQVVVQVTVEENGAVSRAAALTGDPALAKSAMNAAVKWRFEPFTQNGQPLRVEQNLVFNFAAGDKVAELRLPLPEPIPAKLASGSGVYRVGGGVSAPRVLYSRYPEYSDEDRRSEGAVGGTVRERVCVLSLIVGEDGLPREIKVARSLGMGLDDKAIEAVKQWRFNPAMKDGKPVAVAINVEISFRL